MLFHAPWSKKLSYTTLAVVLVLFGTAVLGRTALHPGVPLVGFMVTTLPLLVAGGSSFFIIKGYIVTREAIYVQRLFWNSRIDLRGLVSCEADADALSGSMRTFGNGGLFCIAGYFRNEKLGNYRAYITHPSLAVILKFTDRTIVITPDNPAQFVAAVKSIAT